MDFINIINGDEFIKSGPDIIKKSKIYAKEIYISDIEIIKV